MNKVNFENEYFRYELINGETVITILQDKNKFFGVDISGCRLITDKDGLIKDDFTVNALHQMYKYCNENKAICTYSKNLFGKANLEILQQTEISKRVSKYSIDNGKITKINSEYIEDSIYLNTIIEIDYNNQNLNKLNKSDYKLVNKNS